jgi:hypothetical protein
MTRLGIKTCGKSEFDIFEAKKCFPDSGKPCILKRKVEKCDFCPNFDLKKSNFSQKIKFWQTN